MTLLKPKEVADTLRIDVSSLYRLIREGKISSYRIGSAVRLSQDDLDEYLKTRRLKAINAPKRTRTTIN